MIIKDVVVLREAADDLEAGLAQVREPKTKHCVIPYLY